MYYDMVISEVKTDVKDEVVTFNLEAGVEVKFDEAWPCPPQSRKSKKANKS